MEAFGPLAGLQGHPLAVNEAGSIGDTVGVAAHQSPYEALVSLVACHIPVTQDHIHRLPVLIRHPQGRNGGTECNDLRLHISAGENILVHHLSVAGGTEG